MNTNIRSTYSKSFLVIIALLGILLVSACSLVNRANKSSCSVDLDARVSINVTDVSPRIVFEQLEKDLDCSITIFPGIYKHVTLKLKNATVSDVLHSLCGDLRRCQYTYNGGRLSIAPLTLFNEMKIRAMEKWYQKFEVRLPDGMQFVKVPYSTVLDEISKASGLYFKPWTGEDDRIVTVDLSGMTVDQALEAVVRYIDGEGIVMVRMWSGQSYGQHRLFDK